MTFVFLIPHLLLLSGPDKVSAAVSAAVYLFSAILLLKAHKNHSGGISHPLEAAACSLCLAVLFYLRWQDSAVFAALESLPKMPAKRICGITASVLSLLSLYGSELLVSAAVKLLHGKNSSPVSGRTGETLYIGMCSVVFITLISKCSPFHAFNDWVDPHTMFTVGKSILHGMLPYRDVFEQKGPLLLLLHSVGALISFDSFIGIWLLEIISCFAFLSFSWRIIRMRAGEKALPLVPCLALAVFTSLSFEQGDSAEEFCLPLLFYALQAGYCALHNGMLPKKREWFLIGVTSACVLWMKYSMLGFYLGWIIAVWFFARSQGRGRDVLKGIGLIAAGVLAVTLPILIWFAAADGLPDLFEVYFYENMFLYPKTADLYGNFALHVNLLNGLLNFILFSTPVFISAVLGLIWSGKHDTKSAFRCVLYSFIGLFLVVYFSGRFYTYYSLIFGVFAPYGFLWLADAARKIRLPERLFGSLPGTVQAVMLCLCVLGAFLFSGNMRSLALEKSDYPQYRARDLIRASGIESPTLLNYQFLDMGVNTIAGLMPNQRFFCGFNLPLDEIAADQHACLDSGCTDFVLTYMLEIDSPNYVLLEKIPAVYDIAFIHPTYNLYRKK